MSLTKYFRPKHTVESVAIRLATGLQDGSITLDTKGTDTSHIGVHPAKPPTTFHDRQSDAVDLETLVEGWTDGKTAARGDAALNPGATVGVVTRVLNPSLFGFAAVQIDYPDAGIVVIVRMKPDESKEVAIGRGLATLNERLKALNPG